MKRIGKIIISVFLVALAFLVAPESERSEKMAFGITFSKPFAQFMNLDWKETYLAVLDDLGAGKLRLMSYWTEIESGEGDYLFDDLDWQINEAGKRGAKIILVVGQKQPRWPECHMPGWAKNLPVKNREAAVLRLIKKVIERYKNEESIVAWQVENEPFFAFGECPKFSSEFLDQEIALARSLDSTRPVIISDSGELSSWYRAAKRADILGTTMYRTVWNKNIGYIKYPIPAVFYKLKWGIIKRISRAQKIIIVELQGEAWGHKMPNEMPIEEQYKSMNPDKLRGIAEYAKTTGFSESYFWGAEWWYWLKKVKGEEGMWSEAKKIFSEAN